MKAALFLIAAIGALSSAAADDWPMLVAPEGCTFEWTGPNGYRETAHSHGVRDFPVIVFSRDDWGDRLGTWIPFCGGACARDEGLEALRGLFPLEVGKTRAFSIAGRRAELRVASLDPMERLTGIDAFAVEFLIAGDLIGTSWWSDEIGWMVKYEGGRLRKEVYEVRCPGQV